MTYLLPQTPSGGGITLQGAWKFSTNTAATDPGNKSFKINTGSLAAATNIYINETTDNNADASNILGVLAQGNRIYIQQQDDSSRAALFEISGAPVDNGSWWTIPVTVVSSLTIWQNNRTCGFVLDLSAAGGAGGGYTNVGLEDLTGVNTIDYNDWPDGVYKFRVDYWDVNMNGNSQDPTLRLRNSTGLPVATGYNNHNVEAEQAAFNRIITTDTTRARMDGASGLGLFHGFFEGHLVDPAAFTWNIHGHFYDDFDDSFMHSFCDVTISARLFGLRIQTANVGSMTAGFLSAKYWTQ